MSVLNQRLIDLKVRIDRGILFLDDPKITYDERIVHLEEFRELCREYSSLMETERIGQLELL